MPTPYQILKVKKNASPEAIRKAYQRLARKEHPDCHPGDAKATERFRAIQEAYDLLSNEERKRKFDETGDASKPNTNHSDMEALQIISQGLFQCIDQMAGQQQSPSEHDLVKIVKDGLGQSLNANVSDLNKLKRQLNWFQEAQKRAKTKNEENHITGMCNAHVCRIEEAIRLTSRSIDNHKRAIEILREYTYDHQKRVQYFTNMQWAASSTTT